MSFDKRVIVYFEVANLREIIHVEVAAKRSENARSEYESEGFKITIEELKSKRLKRGNDKMLVIDKFNN